MSLRFTTDPARWFRRDVGDVLVHFSDQTVEVDGERLPWTDDEREMFPTAEEVAQYAAEDAVAAAFALEQPAPPLDARVAAVESQVADLDAIIVAVLS